MAETFKNANLDLTTTLQTAYTVPASTTAIIIHCQVTNVDGSSAADLTLQWTDASNADKVTRLAFTATVPVDASYEPIGGKLTLEAGDTIEALASADDDLELSLSVLELT